MELFFIIGSIQAIIFFLLLITKNNKTLSDKILSIWLFIISIHLLLRYVYSIEIINTFPHLLGVNVSFALLYGPLLLFYVDILTNNRQHFKKLYVLHFIPFLAVNIALIPFYLETTEYKLDLIAGIEKYQHNYFFIILMQLISGPVYVVWILILLKKHKINIGRHFSFTDKVELRWLKNLTLGLAFVWITVLITYAIWEFSNFQFPFEREIIIYTAVTVFVFYIGFKGLKQSPVFTNILEKKLQSNNENINIKEAKVDEQINSRKNTDPVSDVDSKDIVDNLLLYMKEKKPYLEERLMLSDLAQILNIQQYKLTKIINDVFKMNFFNFINSYRIEEVKKQLIDPKNKHFTVLAIAFDCGFSSKASFNRIFKQMTKQTPSEYISSKKNLLENI